jgi:glycosyltransferase involved in cell wall biosynthesis
MKIVFVTSSVPFPARQGVELPLQNIIQSLSKRHNVSMAVICQSARDLIEFEERKGNVPSTIESVDFLRVKKRKRSLSALREVMGVSPTFYLDDFEVSDIIRLFYDKGFDLAWFSPIGNLGLLKSAKKSNLRIAQRIALGHNDATATLYLDGFKQMLKGRAAFELHRMLQGVRLPWIWLYERRILKDVDLIHLQTPIEVKRLTSILPKKSCTRKEIIFAPNGKKESLTYLQNEKSNNTVPTVLFMTHLARGRSKESYWFLKKVWPQVVLSVPSAQLLLVGSPPEANSDIHSWLPENVKICGYVDSLSDVFKLADVSVLPVLHGTGWINRLADSIEAGIPVVGCSEPLTTMPGLEIGVHALKGDSVEEFASNLVRILTDEGFKRQLSENVREFSKTLPTWDQTVGKIESAMLRLDYRQALCKGNVK